MCQCTCFVLIKRDAFADSSHVSQDSSQYNVWYNYNIMMIFPALLDTSSIGNCPVSIY